MFIDTSVIGLLYIFFERLYPKQYNIYVIITLREY